MNLRQAFLCFGLIVVVAIFGVGAYAYWVSRPLPFDAVVWLQGERADFSSNAPRLRMADDLISTGALMGKSRADIASTLGPPTDTSKFRDYDLVYWLGAERSFISIDSEWLAVRFDSTGAVSEASVVRD